MQRGKPVQRPGGGACLLCTENTKEVSVGATELRNERIKGDAVREGRAGPRITVQIAKKKTTVRA